MSIPKFSSVARSVKHTAFALAMTALGVAAHAEVIYSNLSNPLPPNVPSLGYQATSTTEFGDQISFAGTARSLNSVTITMSNWALASTYGSAAAGYNHDLTFNIYSNAANAASGAALASSTVNAFVPWRPEASGNCGSGYLASDGQCYNGLAFNVVFNFSGVILPDDIIFGVSFNTQTYGNDPVGQAGPYNSLNYGLTGGGTSAGTDIDPNTVFWNTGFQGFLTTGTAGTFGPDTDTGAEGWRFYAPIAQFDASEVPEPGSLALVGIALTGLLALRRRRV